MQFLLFAFAGHAVHNGWQRIAAHSTPIDEAAAAADEVTTGQQHVEAATAAGPAGDVPHAAPAAPVNSSTHANGAAAAAPGSTGSSEESSTGSTSSSSNTQQRSKHKATQYLVSRDLQRLEGY